MTPTFQYPKWRVERCGSLNSGYVHGWIAMDANAELGALFDTHTEAIVFADRQARIELERDSKRALMKLASRRTPATGLPGVQRRAYRRATDGEIRAARAMRDNGRTWSEIAHTLGVNQSTIYQAVRRLPA